MDPDHRQSNYWQPPQDEAENNSPVQSSEYEEELDQDQATDNSSDLTDDRSQSPAPSGLEEPVRWQALEHIPQERNKMWFVLFGLVILALLGIAIFFINSWSFTAVIFVAVASVIVYIKRPPREISYTLSQKGLFVGDRLYPLSNYKAFGIIKDGDDYSVMLIPFKRFMPGLTVYFPQDAGEQIVDSLAYRLPMEKLELDMVDRLVRKLRL